MRTSFFSSMADHDRQQRGGQQRLSDARPSASLRNQSHLSNNHSRLNNSDQNHKDKPRTRSISSSSSTLAPADVAAAEKAVNDAGSSSSSKVTPRSLRYARRSGSLVPLDSSLASLPERKQRSSRSHSSGTAAGAQKPNKSQLNSQESTQTPSSSRKRCRSSSSKRTASVSSADPPKPENAAAAPSDPPSKRGRFTKRTRSHSLPENQPTEAPKPATKSSAKKLTRATVAGHNPAALVAPPKKKKSHDNTSVLPAASSTSTEPEPDSKKARKPRALSASVAVASEAAVASTSRAPDEDRSGTSLPSLRRGRRCASSRDNSQRNKEGSAARPAETTGSCASSKRRSAAVSKHSTAAATSTTGAASTLSTAGSSTSGYKLSSAMSSAGRDDTTADHNGAAGGSGQSALAAAIPLLGDGGQDPELAAIDPTAASAAATAAAASAMPTSFAALLPNLDQDANDVGRLQALLEARGLPSHLFGALGPRMHQLLLRSSIGGSVGKAQQLLQGLQSKDEAQQVAAVMEMCQLLVMGNEDTLAGFPMKQVVPALITLLQMEHNFDIMHHACRALTYMMEALPRSSAVVVDAVPVFLEKLQAIQCMDVAEQALQALEMLSKKHNKAILHANGVLACLTYVDFFSLPAQRNALAVTANCCQNLTPDEFHYVQDSLPLLSARLVSSDKKSLESVCLCMARLVDNYHLDEKLLKEIAGHGLLANIQQLLMVTPQVLSSGIFVTVIRMLVLMCSHCPDLAVVLLKQNIAETLCYLLVGPSDQGGASQNIELVQRTPQELYEIVSLIGELMPKLPSDGLFAIDSMLRKSTTQPPDAVMWLWVDDHGLWHPYSVIDSRIIEAAHQSGEHEVNLSIFGGNYTVDFDTMQQINDDTGNARHVQRKANVNAGANAATKILMVKSDSREEILHEDTGLASTFIKTLFGVLYEVYSSSAGPSVRHRCLQAIMRMIYYASPELLNTILASSNVSSHVAAMMASPDLKIVVASIQMANILMDKLPDVFGVYFCREGVMHQIKKLCESEVIDLSARKPDTAAVAVSAAAGCASSSAEPNSAALGIVPPPSFSPEGFVTPPVGTPLSDVFSGLTSQSPDTGKPGMTDGAASSPASRMRLSSVLKHKKPPKRGGRKSGSKTEPVASSSSSSTGLELYSTVGEPFMAMGLATSRSGGPAGLSPAATAPADVTPPAPRGKWGSSSGKSSFLSGLHPSRWGRASSTGPERPVPPVPPAMGGLSHMLYHDVMMAQHHHSLSTPPTCPAVPVADNREKIKQWIVEQATKFSEKHYGSDSRGTNSHPSMSALNQLCTALTSLTTTTTATTTATTTTSSVSDEVESLKQVASIMTDTDMSPFEMIHSGLVAVLTSYLTAADNAVRDARLCRFVQVFLSLPAEETKASVDILSCNVQPFSSLVAKLMNCFHHLEQFQVKVHDLPGGSGTPGRSSNALKFFDTHQLKCNLQRHPACTCLKQWHGGPVKIDPLALVQAIERYLVMRGYGRVRQNADADCSDDDDGSDDDIDDTMAAMSLSHGTGRHRIELLINDHVLPYGMTVYEAVKQFSNLHDNVDTDTDSETPFGSAAIWINTHTIWFRSVSDSDKQNETGSSPRKTKSDRRRPSAKSHRGGASTSGNESSDSAISHSMSALESFLLPTLPTFVTIKDPSLEVLTLLRLLHGLNIHWNILFDKAVGDSLISSAEFLSSKLTAKANRQLQDPLVIMTGNMPQWLTQIARACPFLLPFETRLALFYATSFDRDRAMHRLQDQAHENTPSDSSDRVAPRLERKKSMISRDDILKQADKVLNDLGSGSRAILEIQYENEVGTGLGPTLEFYALVSRELQKADLEMWRGEAVPQNDVKGGEAGTMYMFNSTGLFPAPLARNAKVAHVNKIKSKFRLLGKFMAKALMDSRMLDLPLSEAFYKWMLGQEQILQVDDLQHICPIFAKSFTQLCDVLRQKKRIDADKSHTSESRQLALSCLTLSGGGTVDDLDLDFVLPGYANIELKKGGKDIHVTLDNLDEYLRLVTRWTLVEGTQRQFESFREGFESLFPLSTLSLFYPNELDQLFCGSSYESWSVKYLTESCRPDHGYTVDSQAIKFLFEILSTYNGDEQRQFLQFMTGSPRLPVGGLKSLSPPLTIVRKTVEQNENSDDFLPSVMTCVNYLKLPDYTTLNIMRARLATAASEGQLSFHLS